MGQTAPTPLAVSRAVTDATERDRATRPDATEYDVRRNRLTYATKKYGGMNEVNPERIAAQWPAPTLFSPSGGVVELVEQVRRFIGQID